MEGQNIRSRVRLLYIDGREMLFVLLKGNMLMSLTDKNLFVKD
jgi:hypothetical protein